MSADADSSDDDAELQELKKQLLQERKKTSISEPAVQSISDSEKKPSDDDLDTLKNELASEREKHGAGQTPHTQSYTSLPKQDKEFESLRSELELERKKQGVTEATTKTPISKPSNYDYFSEEKKLPTPPSEKKQEPKKEDTLKIKNSPQKTSQQPPQAIRPKSTVEKDLEDLRSEILSTEKTSPLPGGGPPLTWSEPPHHEQGGSKAVYAVLLIIFLVAAAALVTFYPRNNGPEIRYQCLDGSFVDDISLCPEITTTSTPSTSTTTTTTIETTQSTTSTVPVVISCYNNSMCEKSIPYLPYCDGKYVKNADVKYTCIHPGADDSYCKSLATTPKLIKTCEDSQYCFEGECYPEYCRNKKRDILGGEEKIDCGGPCKTCTSSSILCNIASDCSDDTCTIPYCNSADNPTQNCTRNLCLNAGTTQAECTKIDRVEVIEVCTIGRTCIEGQDDCMPALPTEGTCTDCKQNQGEERIDCGGPCNPCAQRPLLYDTLNLTATDTIEYQYYQLKLDRLLRDFDCSSAAEIRVTDPYGVAVQRKVSFWQNAEYFDLKFGMLDADKNSIRVWINKEIPV